MSYTEKETDIIVADSFRQIGYKQKKLLLASENAENPERKKFALALIKTAGEGVYNNVRAQFKDGAYRAEVLESLSRAGVTCVTVKSKLYPQLLLSTPIPPLVLYARGNVALLETRKVAVVGSRKTSATVIAECVKMCEKFSHCLTVVSGVADGADASALKGGLASGNVISVLPFGHGASFNYNRELLKKVEGNGLSISEHPPKTPALRHHFILRNRIIAGLAEATLVVSAGKVSGALSTARYAVDYSRNVFAFPYQIGAVQGVGCNELIKNGALLCDCAEDVLSSYGIFGDNADEESDEALEEDEAEVLKLLREEGELHAEEIARRLSKSLSDVVSACSMLEIKGYAVKSGINLFTAI